MDYVASSPISASPQFRHIALSSDWPGLQLLSPLQVTRISRWKKERTRPGYEIKDKLDTRAMKIEALSSPGPERKWLVADSGVTRLPSTTLSSAFRSLYGEHHGH